jgi:hypothetical protein
MKIKIAGLIVLTALFAVLPVKGAQTVNLSWNSSTDTNVVGYTIYYGGTSGLYTNQISVGSVTNASVSGLTDGTIYYFAATSRDAAGDQSIYSNETVYSVPSVATLSMKSMNVQGVALIAITAAGTVPSQWAVESSPDLKTWVIVSEGNNSDVNISIPVDTGVPSQFFRLRSE